MNYMILHQKMVMAAAMYEVIEKYQAAMFNQSNEGGDAGYSFEWTSEFQNAITDIRNHASKEPLLKFCNDNKHKDLPLGDLCKDILRDPDFKEATSIYECIAKLISFLDIPHLKAPAKKILNALPLCTSDFIRDMNRYDLQNSQKPTHTTDVDKV